MIDNVGRKVRMEYPAKSKNRKWDIKTWVFFLLTLIAYSVMMYIFFYRQATHVGQWFESDIDAYLLEMQGLDSGFDFPYPIYFEIGRFFMLFTNVKIAAAIATMLLNSLSIIVMVYYVQKTLQDTYENFQEKSIFWKRLYPFQGILSIGITFSLFFVSMLYAPKGIYLPGMDHKYLGVFSPNPIHNQTYLATRPFAIVTFFLFARILSYYDVIDESGKSKVAIWSGINWRDYGMFALFLFLTTMTKPSFTLVLGSTAFLLLVGHLIRKRGKNIIQTIALGVCFVPTIIALLYQFGGVFGSSGHAGSDGGIGFGIGLAWRVYTHNIVLAIMLALAFPGFMMLLNLKELKTNTLYRFSWEIMIVAFLEFLCLYEKGDRFIHSNFSWGYMHGIFFVFVTSIILLIQNTVHKKQKSYVLAAEWLLFAWHLFCGIIYFLYLYSGQFYYSF